MAIPKAIDDMITRVKAKGFAKADAENIMFRLATETRSLKILEYMDKNPEADADALMDEACRLQKLYPRPPRKKKPE